MIYFCRIKVYPFQTPNFCHMTLYFGNINNIDIPVAVCIAAHYPIEQFIRIPVFFCKMIRVCIIAAFALLSLSLLTLLPECSVFLFGDRQLGSVGERDLEAADVLDIIGVHQMAVMAAQKQPAILLGER